MKNVLNRDLIEGLSESSNQEFAKNVNKFIYDLVGSAVTDISVKSPFVRPEKCIIIPVNENYLGSFSQLSEYSYFFGIDNPQIELNSKTRKNFWKNVWKEFKASWRIGKKKYKKKRKQKETVSLTVDKYKLSNLREDLVSKMINYLQESSIVYQYKNCISMIGKDDFGSNVKINIYVCCFDSKTSTFKFYKENKNKYVDIAFGYRFENLDKKVEDCGDMFVNMIKIINALFSKSYNKIPNQILVESLLFNCPNKLFTPDVYQTFVNITNYIRLADPNSFVSICNPDNNIFKEFLITATGEQTEFTRILNLLDNYKY